MNILGERGEQLATDFLLERGYQILERNWRYSRAEIDIVAMYEEVLVFVEVKTRSHSRFGKPESFVNYKKRQFMAEAMPMYMEEIGHEWEVRFDIIAVLLPENGKATITHYPDAFFPTW